MNDPLLHGYPPVCVHGQLVRRVRERWNFDQDVGLTKSGGRRPQQGGPAQPREPGEYRIHSHGQRMLRGVETVVDQIKVLPCTRARIQIHRILK